MKKKKKKLEIISVDEEVDMSAETEIEVSVVSEEDLENSTSTPTPAEMLVQEKNGKSNCSLGSHPFSFETAKAASRPACNPHYTSFSISSILGRAESPSADSTIDRQSNTERGTPPAATTSQKLGNSRESSPSDKNISPSSPPPSIILSSSQRSIINSNRGNETTRKNSVGGSIGCWPTGSTSPPMNFSSSSDPSNPLMGQASANLAMLSR